MEVVGPTTVAPPPFFFSLLVECSSERQECSDPVAAEESKRVRVRRGHGAALEKDPHSTSLASFSHAHVESSVGKKREKNCSLVRGTAPPPPPIPASDLKRNNGRKKTRILIDENHFLVLKP